MLLSTIVDTGIIIFQHNININNNNNSHSHTTINNNHHGLSLSTTLSTSSQPDVYHVAEVLHLCLKNLKFPLFHEIYSIAMNDGNVMHPVYV